MNSQLLMGQSVDKFDLVNKVSYHVRALLQTDWFHNEFQHIETRKKLPTLFNVIPSRKF